MKPLQLILLLTLFLLWSGCEQKGEIETLFSQAEKLETEIIKGVSAVSLCKSNYENILVQAPDSKFAPIACFKLAKLNEVFGHYQEAVNYYRKLVASYPEHSICAKGLLNLAQIYQFHLDRKNDAVATYQQAFSLYGDSEVTFTALLNQGRLLCEEEKWEDALQNFQQIVAAYPENKINDDLCFRMADIFQAKLENPAAATEMYQKIVNHYPAGKWTKYAKERLGELNSGREEK